MTPPRIEEMKFKEYAYQVKHKDCQMILDHDISWCGDCFACSKCGKIFIWSGVANEALTQAHQAGIDEAVKNINNLTPFAIGVGQDPLISKDAVLNIIDPLHQSNTIEDLYLSQGKDEIYQRGKRDGLLEHTCPKAVEKIVYRVKKDHPSSKHLKFGICSNRQLVGQTYNTKEEALVALCGMAVAKTGKMPDQNHTHIIRLQR